MKTIKVIGYGLWVMGMLLVGIPTMAQQQDWKSTSTMPRVGSSLAPTVQQVGAESVPIMATTTESYSTTNAQGKPRRSDSSDPWGENQQDDNADEGYPLGDAVLPLLLCAAVFCGGIALRRKRSALKR